MKNLALILLIVFSATLVFGQETQKKSKKQIRSEKKAEKIKHIKSLVDNKTFVFKAITVIPKIEKTRTLTTDFGMEVRGDSIYSYLPYYGNTYQNNYSNLYTSPMGFIQKIESYKKTKDKSGFEVNIKVNNNGDFLDLTFHISKMGDATLVASSLERQSISYTGEIITPVSNK
jgi:hypothetical protein